MFLARDGTRAPVGIAGLAVLRAGAGEELVVAVDSARTRRGLGRELAEAVLCEASARGCPNVRASVDEGNLASARLLEKLGFVRWSTRAGVTQYVRAG